MRPSPAAGGRPAPPTPSLPLCGWRGETGSLWSIDRGMRIGRRPKSPSDLRKLGAASKVARVLFRQVPLMPLPAIASHYYLPLSSERRRDCEQDLARTIAMFRLMPTTPSYARKVGGLLAELGNHEVACQFFQFAGLMERSDSINHNLVDAFVRYAIPYVNDNSIRDALSGLVHHDRRAFHA